jgi:hypothetical protein
MFLQTSRGRSLVRRRRIGVLACVASILVGIPSAVAARPAPPTPGVSVSRVRLPGPVRLVVVRIDPTVVDIYPVLPTDRLGGYGTVRDVAGREHALVAINGDFAAPDRPAHAIVRDGIFLTSGRAPGAVFAIDPSGTRAAVTTPRVPIWATRLDTGGRARIVRWNAGGVAGDGMIAYSESDRDPTYSSVSPCSVRLTAAAPGSWVDRFRVREVLCDGSPPPKATQRDVVLTAGKGGKEGRWVSRLRPGVLVGIRASLGLPRVAQAFGGAPLLVNEGHVVHGPCLPLRCELHPRSAVALTRGCLDASPSSGCRILLVTADGRQPGWSIGLSTEAFARALIRLGAYAALNLDGGASTQILLEGRNLNRPSTGARRAVVNALIVRPAAPRSGARWGPRIED